MTVLWTRALSEPNPESNGQNASPRLGSRRLDLRRGAGEPAMLTLDPGNLPGGMAVL